MNEFCILRSTFGSKSLRIAHKLVVPNYYRVIHRFYLCSLSWSHMDLPQGIVEDVASTAASTSLELFTGVPLPAFVQISAEDAATQDAIHTEELSFMALSLNFPLEDVVWQYEDDKDQWHSMDFIYSKRHEEQFRLGVKKFPYEHFHGKKREQIYSYCVDLENLRQFNQTTDNVRRIRRLVLCNP